MSDVEHVGGSTAVAWGVTCWFLLSSHASLLRLFRSCLDLLTCFFFPLSEVVAITSFRTWCVHVKVMYSCPPCVSRTNFAHVPLSKHCRYNSSTRVWVVVGVAGDMAGRVAVIARWFGWRPLEATPSPSFLRGGVQQG